MYGNAENIIIHDADNDGEVTLHGKTLSANLSKSGMGRSYTITRSEYFEKFNVDTVRLGNSRKENLDEGDFDENSVVGETGGAGGESETTVCERVPRRYQDGCS
jgi:hypothetical protein